MFMINLMVLVTFMTTVNAEYYGGLPPIITPAPEFDPTPFNVTYRSGDLAVLRCSIKDLGTKTVVWRKVGTSFPLTSGTLTVVADKRFQVGHVDFKSHWDLMIKNVKLEDDGVFECQISSKDRTVRRLITLNVVEPVVEAPEIRITETQYVERGDRVVLECNATGEHYAPDDMDWFRNGQKLTSLSEKGLKITKHYSLPQRTFISVLAIARARIEDDGTYVCRSSSTLITSTKVIVLNAETSLMKRGTAAENNSAWNQSDPNCTPYLLLFTCLILLVQLMLRVAM